MQGGRGGRASAAAQADGAHTANMPHMDVTLDVLKLNGWLKDTAPCRVKRGRRAVRGEVCGPRVAESRGGRAVAVALMQAGDGPSAGGAQAKGGAHVEHAPHGCDLGRVKAQRLVEGTRVLPSRKGGKRAVWGKVGCGASCRERWLRGGTSRGGPNCRCGSQSTGWGTLNMARISVTPEVSQLEMSALKFRE